MTRIMVNMEELNLVRKIISRTPYTSAADRFIFGLPGPVPLVRGTDLDLQINKKNGKQNLDFYCFVTSL
jgi:hypothetical protein